MTSTMQFLGAKERYLKWRLFDPLEGILLIACGFLLAVFTFAVLLNIALRILDSPIIWLNELILGAFVWGTFLGGSVAVRRNEHFKLASFVDSLSPYWQLGVVSIIELVMLTCAAFLTIFGYINFLHGFHNYLESTGTPIAYITASIPVCGSFTALFTLERLTNAWRNILGSTDSAPMGARNY